jgi:hypothetical protein
MAPPVGSIRRRRGLGRIDTTPLHGRESGRVIIRKGPSAGADDLDRIWVGYRRKNPVKAWAGTPDAPKRWFSVDGARFSPRLPMPDGLDDAFAMTRELVDYRLAQYRRRFEP